MTPQDIEAEVREWVHREIGKQALGEQFGYAVTFGLAAMMTPQGPQQIPAWTVLITARSPIVTEGPMYHVATIPSPRPPEKQVRQVVGDGMRQLRDAASSKLAGANGHAEART